MYNRARDQRKFFVWHVRCRGAVPGIPRLKLKFPLARQKIMCTVSKTYITYWYTRLRYNPSRTTSSSSASLAFILGTSCNLVSNACFSSCMAKRFSASSFVLAILVRYLCGARHWCKLTRHSPLDHRSAGSCDDISIAMVCGRR